MFAALARVLLIALVVVQSARADDQVRCTRSDLKFSVEIQWVSRQQAIDTCQAKGVWPGAHMRPTRDVGCNVFYLDSKRCVVITPMPRVIDDGATLNLGHEILHCACGVYHDE